MRRVRLFLVVLSLLATGASLQGCERWHSPRGLANGEGCLDDSWCLSGYCSSNTWKCTHPRPPWPGDEAEDVPDATYYPGPR